MQSIVTSERRSQRRRGRARPRPAFADRPECAAGEIVKKATPEDEAEWLDNARKLSLAELRALVREEAPSYRRPFELDQQGLGFVEDAVAGVRRELGPVSAGQALAEICRRNLEGEAGRAGGPGYRVVVYVCADCGKATRQTSEGELPVPADEVERIECDAEVLDVRDGPARLTRTAPPRIVHFVQARDRGRCVVPGCRNRGVQFHHEDGWRSGHDPERCFSLCDAHHDARHRGFLRVEGAMPDLQFFLADGTYLGCAGDEERAVRTRRGGPHSPHSSRRSSPGTEPAPRSAPAPEPGPGEPSRTAVASGQAAAEASHTRTPSGKAAEVSRTRTPGEEAEVSRTRTPGEEVSGRPEELRRAPRTVPSPVEDAVKALRKLGFNARHAERSVGEVVRRHPGRAWEAGELVRAALVGEPSPARAS